MTTSDRDAMADALADIVGLHLDSIYGIDDGCRAATDAGWRSPAQVITDPDTPDFFPARTVAVDRDGEVWVSRFTDWVVAFDPARGERLTDIVADFGPLTIVYVPTEEADHG